MDNALSSSPSLLPAFEPVSRKRKYEGNAGRALMRDYLTPVPTSSTDILQSSPPPRPTTRPALDRTESNASERVPLGALPSVEIPLNGEYVLMGRSTQASHVQLSASRLISRVHVRASYTAANESHFNGQILVECMGWNGCKVHCRGKVFELGKGDTFTSDKPQADMLVDVQDARILVRWPPVQPRQGSPTRWSDDDTPRRPVTPSGFASSPPPLQLHSPVSPSPRDRPVFTASSTFLGLHPNSSPLRVYEDREANANIGSLSPIKHIETRPVSPVLVVTHQKTPPVSDNEDFSDKDEENDPVIHDFGPTGGNLLARLAATSTASPIRQRSPLKASSPLKKMASPQRLPTSKSPLRNHVINQLAYSRLQSIPLSSIMQNLPAALKSPDDPAVSLPRKDEAALSDADLKVLLDELPCVGEIVREGKDAAGKPLEDEFYYIPELDTDETRRSVVENSLGKRSLRATRKQHKVSMFTV